DAANMFATGPNGDVQRAIQVFSNGGVMNLGGRVVSGVGAIVDGGNTTSGFGILTLAGTGTVTLNGTSNANILIPNTVNFQFANPAGVLARMIGGTITNNGIISATASSFTGGTITTTGTINYNRTDATGIFGTVLAGSGTFNSIG